MGEPPATRADLARRMLRPQGVAVIGASEQEASLGTRYLGGLLRHGFPGPVYPVNPKYDEVMGQRCYASILDVPDPCDCAVLSVREELVEQTLSDCAQRGLGGVVIFAGGYRETGPEGAEKERRLAELAREVGIRFIGPNSPGFVNFVDQAIVTATSVAYREDFPAEGSLGVVAQSGGVAGIIAERAMDRGLGLSFMLCCGNEADFDTPEAIEFLVDDPDTDAIALYYEGVADEQRLLDAWGRAAEAGKPVVTFTPGTSEASTRAASKHTGSAVGDDPEFERAARDLGVLRMYDLDELLQTAIALPKLRRPNYDRVLLLTTTGGGSVLTADAIGRKGITLPDLPAAIREGLAETLSSFSTIDNPVDVTSDPVQNPPSFLRSIELCCQSEEHDVVVLTTTVQGPVLASTYVDTIVSSPQAKSGELVVLWYAGAMSDDARRRLRSEGVIVFETPRALAEALSGAATWNCRDACDRPPAKVPRGSGGASPRLA